MKSPAERSMDTATATTVSTVGSDYTMEHVGGMRKAKRTMPWNSDDAGRDNTEPVIWYAFFSEKAGREYYYEPKSKTVTWVMPDDHHRAYPDHRGNSIDENAEGQSELMPAPKVKRKVRWVSTKSSEEKGQLLSDQNTSDSMVDKTIGKKLLVGAACVIVLGGAFCLGRLSDGGLHAGAADLVMPPIVPNDYQHDAEVHVKPVAVLGQEGRGHEGKVQSALVGVDFPEMIEANETEEMLVAEAIHHESDQQEDEGKKEETEEEKSSPPPALIKCKIPFAYIISRECRSCVPLFDAEAFSLLMMQ